MNGCSFDMLYNVRIFLHRILVWGAGKFGQLGNGVRRDIPNPQDISRSLNIKNKVVQVSQLTIQVHYTVVLITGCT